MKKIVIAVIVIAVLAVAGYFVVKSIQGSTQKMPTAQNPKTSIQPVPNPETPIQDLPSLGIPMKPTTDTTTTAPTPTPTTPTPTPPPVANKTVTITIQNFAFSPASLTINKGDTVVWTNNDSAPHNVVGGVLASPTLNNGGSYSYKFTNSGTVNYKCTFHPSMTGVITVR